MKNKIKNIIYNKSTFIVSIFAILLFMVVGYSSLTEKFIISSKVSITTPEYSIIIKDINVIYKTNEAGETTNSNFNGTEAALYSGLPNTNSTIIYDIKIKNNGLTSGILEYIFTSLDNDNVNIKIGGINNGRILKAGEEVSVTVELSYFDNVTIASSTSVSSLINFEFIPLKYYASDDCTSSWNGSTTSTPSIRNVYGVNFYEISKAEELAWFANYANNTSNNINAILTNDICLNSNKLSINNYTGIFDGQDRTISGYYVSNNNSTNKNFTIETGLFIQNDGIIKNVNLNGTLNEKLEYKPGSTAKHNINDYLAGISVRNNGKILNSSFNGSITAEFITKTNCYVANPRHYDYIGGIASINNGVVSGSYNLSSFKVTVNSEASACYYGRYTGIYMGGIVGQNNGYISDSYNNSPITLSATVKADGVHYIRTGGIVGDLLAGGVKNSYNSGVITSTNSISGSTLSENYIGGAIGNSSATISNVYYLDTVGFASHGKSVSSSDLSNLNINIGNYFMKDSNNINSGYPILKWQ